MFVLQEMVAIHPRALEVAQVVERFCDEHGFSPTVREIAEITGLRSSETVQRWIGAAIRAGLVQHESVSSRTIRPVRKRCSHGRP